MRRSTLTQVAGILILAIISGALIGWWVSRREAPPETLVAPQPKPAQTRTESRPASDSKPEQKPDSKTEANSQSKPTATTVEFVSTVPEWEERLGEILISEEMDEDEKGRKLLAAIPGLPEEAQVEYAEHMVNLLSDEDFDGAGKLLLNMKTPKSVMDVILNDLLNRDDELKLPLLLNVARLTDHPMQAEAKESLEMYVDEDYGNDWAKWEKAVKKLIKGE